MIDKEKYFNEVDKLLKNKVTNIDKKDFIILLKAMADSSDLKKEEDIEENKNSQVYQYIVNKVIWGLFGGIYKDTLVPWDFFDTEIGKVIIKVKFGMDNEVYFINDLVQLTGFSKQFLGREIKNGNIRSHRKHGIYYAYANEVNEYLKMKKFPTINDRRKSLYQEIKEEIINPEFEREEKY